MKIEFNENKEMCKQCGGECCKNCGCELSPTDFVGEITFERIIDLLKTGLVSIDCWEGDPRIDLAAKVILGIEPPEEYNLRRAYFLRMRNVETSVINYSWGLVHCILLSEEGCRLDFNHRPCGGRALVPKKDIKGHCESDYSKRESSIEWIEYESLLEDAISYINKNDLDNIEVNLDRLEEFKRILKNY